MILSGAGEAEQRTGGGASPSPRSPGAPLLLPPSFKPDVLRTRGRGGEAKFRPGRAPPSSASAAGCQLIHSLPDPTFGDGSGPLPNRTSKQIQAHFHPSVCVKWSDMLACSGEIRSCSGSGCDAGEPDQNLLISSGVNPNTNLVSSIDRCGFPSFLKETVNQTPPRGSSRMQESFR